MSLAQIVSLENVSVYYNKSLVRSRNAVLENLTFHARAKQTILIHGANGSGKSTLLKIIVGLLPIQKGSRSVSAKRIGYVPQYCIAPPWLKAEQFLKYKMQILGVDQTHVDHCLQLVSLFDKKEEYLRHFSPGMLQRLWIAHALLGNPDLLILDEPFSHIESSLIKQCSMHLHNATSTPTIIMVTHIRNSQFHKSSNTVHFMLK